MPVIDPSTASPLPDSAATLAPPDPSRRRILIAGATLAAAGLLSPFARASGSTDPFTLGVAAGDPLADGFVSWTRLAPARWTRTDAAACAQRCRCVGRWQRPKHAHHRAPGRDRCQPRLGPTITDGVQGGDVLDGRAMLWSRANRPARLRVEWDTRPSLRQERRVDGTIASAAHDFTARADLSGLPRNQDIFYRVRFEDADSGVLSAPVHGHLRSAPQVRGDVRFVWSGDTVGQGFGINPDIGGMRIYNAMRERNPDFFLHSGDTIYADNQIPAELTVEDGKRWRKLTTAAKSKVAETLDEFRGNYRYNLLDEHVRRFNAEVPQIWQWDDHETTNNWSPGKQLDARYRVRDIDVLAKRARQAFLEYAPMRGVRADGNGRIYRKIAYGPLLDVFVLDMPSDRGANSDNLQPQPSPDAAFLGTEQLAWLQRELAGSRAQWK